jgi:hypothetical protein
VVLGAISPAVAFGQERSPAAIGSGEGAAFQAQGFPAGGFRIYPTVSVSTAYDDNIVRTVDGKRQGDGSFIVAPALDARSNWSSNQLNGNAFYRSTHYFQRTEQDNDEYGARVNGRVDVMRTTKVTGDAGYARLTEGRGTPGDLFLSNRLILYNTFNAGGQISHQFNRVGLTIGVRTVEYRYDDIQVRGTTIDQGFRSRDIDTANGRVEYQYSAVTSLFVSGAFNRTSYGNARPLFDRSSQGFTALAGVRFELSRLLNGQVGIGYIRQNFSDLRFTDFSGANYDITLNYKPTLLTSISLSAGRRLTDSALLQVVGVLTHDVDISVEHELLRNVTLQGSIGYSHYEYRGISREDNRYNFGLSARYRMNRFLSGVLRGQRTGQDSGDVLRRQFSNNRATLSLVFAR